MFSDPPFQSELEKALWPSLGKHAANTAAKLLAPAYNPEPRRRPAAVEIWAEEVAAALLQA